MGLLLTLVFVHLLREFHYPRGRLAAHHLQTGRENHHDTGDHMRLILTARRLDAYRSVAATTY
jgi:hypothetical protein